MTHLFTTGGAPAGLFTTDGMLAVGGTQNSGPTPDPGGGELRMQVTNHTWANQERRTTPFTSVTEHEVFLSHTGTSVAITNRERADDVPVCAFEGYLTIDGVSHPLTWESETAVTVEPGTTVDSDPLDITVEAGTTITLTTTAVSGDTAPVGQFGGTHRPSRITGVVDEPAVAVIALGSSSAASPGGLVSRALDAAQRPWTNISYGGGSASTYAFNSPVGRYNATITSRLDHTHALVDLGANSAAGGAENFKTLHAGLWQVLADHGYRVAQTTMKPYTDSTDGWATFEGQTVKYPGYTTGVNLWLRDGAPILNGVPQEVGAERAARAGQPGHPLSHVIDAAAPVEDYETEKWAINSGPLSTDGIHMTETGHALMAGPIQDWAETLTPPGR